MVMLDSHACPCRRGICRVIPFLRAVDQLLAELLGELVSGTLRSIAVYDVILCVHFCRNELRIHVGRRADDRG